MSGLKLPRPGAAGATEPRLIPPAADLRPLPQLPQVVFSYGGKECEVSPLELNPLVTLTPTLREFVYASKRRCLCTLLNAGFTLWWFTLSITASLQIGTK